MVDMPRPEVRLTLPAPDPTRVLDWSHEVQAAMNLAIGVLPAPLYGVSVGIGLRSAEALGVALAFEYNRSARFGGSDVTLVANFAALRLDLSWRWLRRSNWSLGFVSSTTGGVLAAQGDGLSSQGNTAMAPQADARLGISIEAGNLDTRARMLIQACLPLVRHRFLVETPTGTATLASSGTLGALISMGIRLQ